MDRLDLSPIEQAFWNASHSSIPNLQVQQVIGRYRVDFLVPDKMLVIEVDGHEYHSSRPDRIHDAQRQRYLEEQGYRVTRFTGSEIHADVDKCVRETVAWMNTLPARQQDKETLLELSSCTGMQEVVTHLLDKHGIDVRRPYFHLELAQKHFDNLVIGREGNLLGVFHYFVTGRVMFDPHVEFIIARAGDFEEWLPSRMTTLFGRKDYAEVDENGNVVVLDATGQQRCATYAGEWAKRLRLNGWFANAVRVET